MNTDEEGNSRTGRCFILLHSSVVICGLFLSPYLRVLRVLRASVVIFTGSCRWGGS